MVSRSQYDHTLAVVGGAAAGIHLLAELSRRAVQGRLPEQHSILLVDPTVRPNGGSPHSDRSRSFRVNMATDRHDVPGQRSLRAFLAQYVGTVEDPPRRADVGAYLDFVEIQAIRDLETCGHHVQFQRTTAQALRRGPHGGYDLVLGDGGVVSARHVVIATGNATPTIPGNVKGPGGWLPGVSVYDGGAEFARDVRPHHAVGVLGAGPGAIDVARYLLEEVGVRRAVTLVSQTGRLSAVQSSGSPSDAVVLDVRGLVARLALQAPVGLAAVLHEIRAVLARHDPSFDLRVLDRTPTNPLVHLADMIAAAEHGGPAWRQVVEAIGGVAPDIWRLLSPEARVAFVARWQRGYYVARHAMQLPTARWVGAQLALDRVRLGCLRSDVLVTEAGITAIVDVLPAGPAAARFDRLVIATGPEYRVSRSTNPLIRQLLDSGMARPYAVGGVELGGLATTGLEVDGLPGVFAMGAVVRGEDFAVHSFPALVRHAATVLDGVAEAAGAPVTPLAVIAGEHRLRRAA